MLDSGNILHGGCRVFQVRQFDLEKQKDIAISIGWHGSAMGTSVNSLILLPYTTLGNRRATIANLLGYYYSYSVYSW
jgi:hypothetical protein